MEARCPHCENGEILYRGQYYDCSDCFGRGQVCAYHGPECSPEGDLVRQGAALMCPHHARICDYCGGEFDHLVEKDAGWMACPTCLEDA